MLSLSDLVCKAGIEAGDIAATLWSICGPVHARKQRIGRFIGSLRRLDRTKLGAFPENRALESKEADNKCRGIGGLKRLRPLWR